MAIELKLPHRGDYESEHDYALACSLELASYQRKLAQAIDRTPELRTDRAKSVAEQQAARAETVHEYLQRHPRLLERYKKFGPIALLMLD